MKTRIFVSILLVTIFLAACGPAYLPAPTSTPIPSPQPTTTPDFTVDIKTLDDETEAEIVSFMLNYILQPRTNGKSYVETVGEPWLSHPPSVTCINYSPPNTGKITAPWRALNSARPIKAWWYFDYQLVEATDSQMAMQKWNEYYVQGTDASANWDYIGFGVLSVSNHNTKATIFFEMFNCSTCSAGWLTTLEKNASGKWTITKDERLWVD